VLVLVTAVRVPVQLLKLAQFLFERHLRQQRVDLPLDVCASLELRERRSGRDGEDDR
jgi:hypothetical protein